MINIHPYVYIYIYTKTLSQTGQLSWSGNGISDLRMVSFREKTQGKLMGLIVIDFDILIYFMVAFYVTTLATP